MLLRRLLFGLFALGLLSAADPPPCLGAWQNTTEADNQIAFEPDRMITAEGCLPARYPDAVSVRLGWRGESRQGVTVTGDTLVLTQEGKTFTFRRLPALPQALQLTPMVFPPAAPIPADQLAGLKKECAVRLEKDQAVRNGKQQNPSGAVDADNTAWLKAQIARFGWLDSTRCGKEVAGAAFLIVQHSGDMPLMQAALPCIEADLKATKGDPQAYALLYDRVQIFAARRQRYGTQIGDYQGRPAILPLEDRAKVDALRAKIRLFPMKNYLAMLAQAYRQSPASFVYMDDLPPLP